MCRHLLRIVKRKQTQRIWLTAAILIAGCSTPLPSPFAELERTRPVSTTKIRSVATCVDGATLPQQGAQLEVHANQQLIVYGTVEDGEWKFGGTGGIQGKDAFAWRKDTSGSVVSPHTNDEQILVCSHVHRMASRSTLAKPAFEAASLIVAANRGGADFEFRLKAPAKAGEYVLDLLGSRMPIMNDGVAVPLSGEAIFWRGKLRVTLPH